MAAIIPKVRAGNQFTYLWAIERAGVAVDLTTATDIDLSYRVGKPCADYSKIPFTVVDINKISSSHLYGVTGTYNLKLEFKIDGEQSTIDIDAFKIVPRSEDASDSSQFAVTSDMAIGFKGDKLTFADLTTSDIAELQRPANDAIASIQAVEVAISGNENNRVDAEYDRNQEEINRQEQEVARQTNTSTAIQNAQTATTNAQTATTNANTATTSANNAATLANTKAGLADTAATNANNVANGYAAELALKEVKANRQNSLAVDGTGVKFPTVDAVNGGLGGKQATLVSGTNIKTMNGQSLVGSGDIEPNLLATYIHSGNLEIAPTSVDLATGTFTKSAHGLINGDRISPIINIGQYVYPYNVYPRGLTNTDTGHYVVNSTADTFQISLTSGGAAVTFTANALMDLTKWHFEKYVPVDYGNSNIKLTNSFKIIYSLRLLRTSNMYIGSIDADKWVGSDTIPQTSDINVGIVTPNSLLYACHFGYAEQKYVASPNMSTIHTTAKQFQTGTTVDKFSLKYKDGIKIINSNYRQDAVFWIYGIYPANGFSFKIYSL